MPLPLSLGTLPIAAALIGSVAAAAGVAWLAVGSGGAAQPGAVNAPERFYLCVDADGIRRRRSEPCGGGDPRVQEDQPPEQLACPACSGWHGPPAPAAGGGATAAEPEAASVDRVQAPEDPLSRLERRVAALDSDLLIIVDDEGSIMFSVSAGEAKLYNKRGKVVAGLYANGAGGAATVRKSDGSLATAIQATDQFTGMVVNENNAARLMLGSRPNGNYGLVVLAESEHLIAAIGESNAGSGVVLVNDVGGNPRASLSLGTVGGQISIFAANASSAAALLEGSHGAGLLEIAHATRGAMVKMGVNEMHKYGIVLAGPVLGLPLVTGSGLPGSYILGCSGGNACDTSL